MNEETRQRIFEPFFTTKPAGHGTGLGLATVQGIVAQSGGYIDVTTEPGCGTTFKIYLPALAQASPHVASVATVPALGGTETVLVVEDLAEVRDFAVTVLQAYGYRVCQAASGAEALLLCARERIHLVLTDVVMPNLSGRELATRLETLRPDIHVLFMSGYSGNVNAPPGVLDQGVHFIEKPFSAEELARKVRAVLGAPSPAASILVAEDEAAMRGFLRAILQHAGYQVIEAADGMEALQKARSLHVDLVIADLVLPEREGLETIQALRREVPGVRLIAISETFGDQSLKTPQLPGADAVLGKPVNPEVLLATVAKVLNPRQ
jgi:CheY-like chemotaxis protein